MVDNSHIDIRPDRAGRPRAYVAGTRVRVQDIYIDSEVHGMTPDEIAAGFPQLTLAQIHGALAYYFDHRDEIQNEVREDRDLVQEMKGKTGSGPLERKIKGSEAQRDSVSSR